MSSQVEKAIKFPNHGHQVLFNERTISWKINDMFTLLNREFKAMITIINGEHYLENNGHRVT